MRKTIATVFVVLLAILAVSCDSVLGVPNEDKAAKYDADGRELVKLNITTSGALGNSRSLTNALAKIDVDFVEVIFKGSTQYYRATGGFGGAIPISVEKKDYTTADAVMFIGKMVSTTDYKLLAVGYLTGTLSLKSNPGSTTANFTLANSLNALLNVNAPTSPSPANGPAFAITDSFIKTVTGWTDDDHFKNGRVGSLRCFQVPKDSSMTAIPATLTIGGFPAISSPPVITPATPTVTFTKNNNENSVPVVGTLNASSAVINNTTGNCVLTFTFDTSGADVGAYIITFNIPVGFDGDSAGLAWNIRGGTLPGIAESNAAGSKAEGVLISVQTLPNRDLSDITAITPTLPPTTP